MDIPPEHLEQFSQDHRGRSPDFVGTDSKEGDTDDPSPDLPVFLGRGLGSEELLQGNFDYSRDLTRVTAKTGTGGSDPHKGGDLKTTHRDQKTGKVPAHLDRAGVDPDLLLRFTEGGSHQGFSSLARPTGEGDLALVVKHV